jgi:hypothetical protein
MLVKDFHCACKRNAKLESLSKNGGEVICDLWILITFYTGLHSKFWNQDLPILHWASKWALLYWDTLFVRDNVPCFSFFLLFQGTLLLILLYLYMLARQEQLIPASLPSFSYLNTPKKLKVKDYRWWAARISWKLEVQMEGASPSYQRIQ